MQGVRPGAWHSGLSFPFCLDGAGTHRWEGRRERGSGQSRPGRSGDNVTMKWYVVIASCILGMEARRQKFTGRKCGSFQLRTDRSCPPNLVQEAVKATFRLQPSGCAWGRGCGCGI